MPYIEFLSYAESAQKKAVEESGLDDGNDALQLFFVTSMAQLYFDCAANSGACRQQSKNYMGKVFYAG